MPVYYGQDDNENTLLTLCVCVGIYLFYKFIKSSPSSKTNQQGLEGAAKLNEPKPQEAAVKAKAEEENYRAEQAKIAIMRSNALATAKSKAEKSELNQTNNSAKHYLDEANKLFLEKDYEGVFIIIDKAFSLYEPFFNHYLHNAKGECFLALELEFEASDSFISAIKLIKEHEPENSDQLNKYIENKNKCFSKKNVKTTIASIESAEDGKQIILKLANGVKKLYPVSYIDKVLESHFLSDALPTILIGTEVTYDVRAFSKGDQLRNEKDDSLVISKHTNEPIIRTSGGLEIIKFRFGAIDENAIDDHMKAHMLTQAMAKLKQQEPVAVESEESADKDGMNADAIAKVLATAKAAFLANKPKLIEEVEAEPANEPEQQDESFKAGEEVSL